MKFDKKLMESGIVAAFSLALTVSTVCGTNATSQVPDSQEVELSAEPVEFNDELVAATKIRKVKDIVAASIMEHEPEQEAEDIQEVLDDNKAAENHSESEPVSVGLLAEALKTEPAKEEEISEADEEITEEHPKDGEGKEDKEEIEHKEEDSQAEALAEQPKKEEEAKSEEETKPEENKEGAKPEEQVKNEHVAVGTEEVSPWASKLLPNVEDYLNIRTEPSDEAELAGKLHKGASAEILEKGDEWTKISSGSVEGYVKNEYCVTGLEAEDLANQVGTTYAIAVTGGVRVRENTSASEDTAILDVLEEGGKIKVDTGAEAAEGWVAVKMDEGVGYVSAEYVNVELKLGKAISIEEERAAIAAAEAEEAKKAQQASAEPSQRGAVSASYDDVTLLAALIQCEAGGEPYEGQLAVGAVVMNRVRAGYAGSISGVIYQGGQFTPASNGMLANALAGGVSGSCMQAAQEAIAGASNVGGATSFRNAASGASGIVIGNHVFF